MKHSMTFGLMAALAATSAFGCAGVPSTTQTAPQAQTAERHVQALGDQTALKNFYAQLPKTLTPAQADKMLITIDPSKIREPGKGSSASVAWPIGGLLGAYARPGWWGYGYGSLTAAYARFRYLTVGSTLVPYAFGGLNWSPYYGGSYFNIFEAALGYYYPWNIPANWCCQ